MKKIKLESLKELKYQK